MKKWILLLIVIGLWLILCGCEGEAAKTTEPFVTEKESPFSEIVSDHYETYEVDLKPLSATLYKNGEVISIDVNDARLVRLLNYFNKALSSDQCAYALCYVSPEKSGIQEDFRLELTYEPQGDVSPGPYENAPTKFDTIVVTNTSFDFALIDHSRQVTYMDTVYPFLVAIYLPFEMNGNCLEMFGF